MTVRQVAYRLKSEGKAELKRDFAEIGQAGAGSQQQIAAAADRAAQASGRLLQATEEQRARYRAIAQAANEAAQAQERQARFNAVLGVGRAPGRSAQDAAQAFMADNDDAVGRRAGMSRAMRTTAIYTASDLISSAASGINPAVIALQQGPQVLQAIALEGGNAAGSILKLTAVLGGVAAVLGATVGSWLAYDSAMNKLEATAGGLGRTAGLTASQVDQLAVESAKLGDVTIGAAREMASAYLGTGRIGGEVMSRLIGLTKSYAFSTAQDAKAATAELAQAMADPARGVDVLNGKLSFLDDTTYRYIQTLIAQNRTTEAQMAILDALGPRVLSQADHVNAFGRAWSFVKQEISETINFYGQLIDRMAGGGPLEERIAKAIKDRERLNPWVGISAAATAEARRLDSQIQSMTAQWRQRIIDGDQARVNQIATAGREARERANPNEARLRQLQADASALQLRISTPGASSDLIGDQRALDKLKSDIAAVKAGYSSASEQASAFGRSQREAAAEARRNAQEAKREAEEAARNAQRLADLELRQKLNLARIRDQKDLVAELEREQQIRQLANEYAAAGVPIAQARARAEREVGQEMRAQYEARLALMREEAKDVVSMAERLKGQKIVYDENADALRAMGGAGERAFDILADKVAYGSRAWGSWKDAALDAIAEIQSEMIRLVVLNPLKNALFGQNNPTGGGGFLGSLLKGAIGAFGGLKFGGGGGSYVSDLGTVHGLPGFANGTQYAPGGWAWVGERGPELVRLPQASQVFDHSRSTAMGRAVNLTVNIDASGAFSEETLREAVAGGVNEAVRKAGMNVLPIVNDGVSRGMVGG